MKAQVYCKTPQWGTHNFYLRVDKQDYYLFSQDFRKGVHSYFSNGILIDQIYDFSKARGDSAIIHTLEKLPRRIKYIENEYGIAVRKQTRQKPYNKRFPECASA